MLVKVIFDGDTIYAIRDSRGEIYVVIKRVCLALGVTFASQLRKLRTSHWASVVIMTTVAPDGAMRNHSCLPLKRLPMWLAQIHVGKVAEELREKLMRYQVQAAEALDAYFNPQQRAITAKDLQPFVDVLVEHEVKMQELYDDQTELHTWARRRIDRVEKKLIRERDRRAELVTILKRFPSATTPVPKRPTRAPLCRWIAAWVAANTNATDEDYSAAWHRLFDEMDDRFRIRCRIRAANQNVKPIDILDQLGFIPAAYTVCQRVFPIAA